ncbi:hypothetical protein PHET_06374 [Paragonimus heterotremus]|uniref:Uncharacterized protein n=1 Tax=Paragonimus heterotremus TaxID=100268 RepID=A0A8J4TJH9_9TREM|nr:hypothetical protein PHET_06374 [Paragonimus heterotremus]
MTFGPIGMSSPDVAEPPPTLELSDSSSSDLKGEPVDWREKACELMEKHLAQLVETNACLAEKSSALAACLLEVLSDVTTLSSFQRDDELSDTEWLHSQLVHAIRRTSQTKPESTIVSVQSANHTMGSTLLSCPGEDDTQSVRLKRALNIEFERKPKQRKTHHTPKSESPLHHEFADRAQSLTGSDSDESALDSETIRAAFRLFAQHIGPSLKREYRAQFGCPPSQSWLADQLLARWDGLSPAERRTWNKRA